MSIYRPCIDPDAQTAHGKAINHIGLHCLGNDMSCHTCNLALYLEMLNYSQEGLPVDQAYQQARHDQEFAFKVSQEKYELTEMHSSDLTLHSKTTAKDRMAG